MAPITPVNSGDEHSAQARVEIERRIVDYEDGKKQ
jgi:hypothetical protein